MSFTLILALSLSGLGDVDRVAAASGASPRPQGCRARSARWSEVHRQADQAYCRAIALGYASLSTEPRVSLARAAEALDLRPQSAPALVLHARSLARLGKHGTAVAEFARAASSSPASMASAHLDHARALAALGKWVEAEAAYRRALPVRTLLAEGEGPRSVLEAAVAALLAGGDRSLERCEGLLWPLLRTTTTVTGRPTVARLLGLVLTLRGQESQGRELVAGAPDGAASVSDLLPRGVADMVAAWTLEPSAAVEARARWRKVANGGGPSAMIARQRLVKLGGS